MFTIWFSDGSWEEFTPDQNEKGQELWGIEDPTGWVYVIQDGKVSYFPTWRILSVQTSLRPKVADDVPAD